MNEQNYEYRTGRTEPQKKHNGIIAFLLILVIFLSGLASVLGILNIHLFRLLDEKDDTPLSFAQAQDQATAGTGEQTLEGMTIVEIPDIYQQMCDLPHGLYIAHVAPDSHAQQQGIAVGDVLTHFAGKPVSQLADLQGVLEGRYEETADLTICRNGTEQTFTIILTGE